MEACDVAVIGGGITGVSAANHLAAAGYATVLLERGDFGGATSGRTSRLQYCGLSYFSKLGSLPHVLRHPRGVWESVELARRAMRDRSGFVRATPERVRPVTFFFPLYGDGSIPVWQVRAGFALLERLDRGGVPLDVTLLAPAEARQQPMLAHLRDQARLRGVFRYTEYQFDWPERICVDTALNAADLGAEIRNHTPVARLERGGDGIWTVETAPARGGAAATLRARAVVNAAGVWVDEIAGVRREGAQRLNQGLKGCNVMLRLPEAFRGLGFETLTRGGEPFYVIPWDDLHYIGPRNRPADSGPDGYRVTAEEIAALVDEMNFQFPALGLLPSDALYAWAGVRPRTARPGHPGGASASLLHDPRRTGVPDYYVYTGGLLMTHRAAGRAIAAALAERTRPSRPARPVPTAARRFPDEHNTPAIAPDYPGVSLSDLRFAAAQERVRSLEDSMFRRVRLGWTERMGADVAHEVAHAVREAMGWTPAQATAQAVAYRAGLLQEFGFAAAPGGSSPSRSR